MTEELANIDLLKSGSDNHDSLAPRRRLLAIVAVLVIAILLLGGAYFWLRRGRSETTTTPATQPADAAVKVRQEPAELISLPPLDQTDPLVRQLVGALSSHPVVASWLTTDRLISNFVVVTSKIADGQSPTSELKTIGPVPPFKVRSVKGALFVDPSSYHRYDRYAQAVSALDAQGAARLYETLKPRINEADRNFGGAGQFDAEMQRAIDELLKVPVVEGEVALRMSGIGYAYADPALEGLSPPQKQLLRMGPENVKAIQAKLREIASFLQLSVPSR
jgi:Protein of unknown function (DUF3014)